MIFSNLAGTTNNQFKVNGDGTGQILSNNAYDLFWACPDPITGAKNPNVRLLPMNADLDEYRLFPHMGQWYSTMETTATIKNLPTGVTAEFTLLILTNSGNWDGYLRQEIVTNDGVKFERRFNGFQTPSWSAWKQAAYKSDISALHSVARSGDYNDLINKPNSSSGPTLETGIFTLESSGAYIDNNSSSLAYVKYGNVVQLDITVDIYPNANAPSSGLLLSGWPFFPKETTSGVISDNTGVVTTANGTKQILFSTYFFYSIGSLLPILYCIDNNNFYSTPITDKVTQSVRLNGTILYLTK